MKFLHKGDCYHTEIVPLVHFIKMQLNFSVLSMFSFVVPQKAGFWQINTCAKFHCPSSIVTLFSGGLIHSLVIESQTKSPA